MLVHLKQYAEIWALDEEDPFKRPEGGESVEDVASRLAKAVLQMESQFQGYTIFISSSIIILSINRESTSRTKEKNETFFIRV